ncbi:MAG: SusC/RagA family TonB-linked outer membrane protein [Draconibacterium sp.]
MKLTFLLILISFIGAFATESYSQTTRLTLSADNLSLEEFLIKIENQSEFRFFYTGKIDVEHQINGDFQNRKITEILDEIAKEVNIKYEVMGRQIILSPEDSGMSLKSIQAQRSISGVVSDSNGHPLPGVTIIVKGTTKGTVTSADGSYSLEEVSEDAILVFSFIGMKTQEVAVSERKVIDLVMTEDAIGLDEVVAVGYGTQSKRWVTGSISKVDMEKSETFANTNVVQSLRGSVAGVQVTDNGRPGQEGTILIRGPRSLAASNDPLIVLDGIIFNGSMANINPHDIQSIEILKDASSTAIYGSRAANGVILVTSKSGISEKPVINFSALYGVSEMGYKVKLFNPERYLQSKIDFLRQSGEEVDPSDIGSFMNASEADNYMNGIISDPWDMASQDGGISTYNLSMAGRNKNYSYYISGSYSDEKGVIYNDNQERISSKVNMDATITDWLKLGINANFSQRDVSGVSANLLNVYHASPYGTYNYDDGNPTQYLVPEDVVSGNPLYRSILTNSEIIYRQLFSNLYAIFDVPFIKGLNYRINFAPNLRWNHNYNSVNQDPHRDDNIVNASKLNQESVNWFLENIITYDKYIGENHRINLTLLYGREHLKVESTTATANQLIIDVLGYNNLSLGDVLLAKSSASSSEGVSSMFRLNYTLKDKYLLTLTARRDGSSVFSENNKYATFPSAAIAWIASEESIIKNISVIDLLKIRLSYGSVGNKAISPYQSLSLSGINQYVYGDGGSTSIGIYPSRMGNSDLKWETTYTANAAIDFSLFKGRLNGTMEFYDINTHDLIVQRSIPAMNGFDHIYTNIGQTNNKGIELSLNTINVQSNKFEWTSSLSFSANRNKIVHLYNSDADGDGVEDSDISNNWFVGHPITSYYDYVIDGIYQEGDTDIPSGYQPGFVQLKDLDGIDGITTDDRTIIGSGGEPDFRIGLGNTFKYGDISLSIFANSMLGWISPFPLLNTSVSPNAPGRGLNQLDAGYWTQENSSNTRPSLVYNNPYSHGWYMSRNFLRIQDVSLSYEFSTEIVEKLKISNLLVYLSGKNLYTFTNWLGSDPESGGIEPDEFYPMPRTISMGVNISF